MPELLTATSDKITESLHKQGIESCVRAHRTVWFTTDVDHEIFTRDWDRVSLFPRTLRRHEEPVSDDLCYRFEVDAAGPDNAILLCRCSSRKASKKDTQKTYCVAGTVRRCEGGTVRHVILDGCVPMDMMMGMVNEKRRWKLQTTVKSGAKQLNEMIPTSALLVPQWRLNTTGKLSEVVNLEEEYWTTRYFGIWDLDVRQSDWDEVVSGKVSLFNNKPACKYESAKAAKKALVSYYKECREKDENVTVREIYANVPVVQRQMELARKMADSLPGGFAVCTGNKGAHVYCTDASMFRMMWSSSQFGDEVVQQQAEALFEYAPELRDSYDPLQDSDCAIHRDKTGAAVRLTARESTGMWTVLLQDGPLGLDAPAFPATTSRGRGGTVKDPPPALLELRQKYHAWWRWLRAAAPPPIAGRVPSLENAKIQREKARKNGTTATGRRENKNRKKKKQRQNPENSQQVNSVLRRFQKDHGLQPLAIADKAAVRRQISLSIQTTRYPSIEYNPSVAELDTVLRAAFGTVVEQVARHGMEGCERVVPSLNESLKVDSPLRFAVDIDDFELSEKHFATIRKAVRAVAPECSAKCIVSASTAARSETPAGSPPVWSKVHITWPELVLERHARTLLVDLVSTELRKREHAARLPKHFKLDTAIYTSYLRVNACPKPDRSTGDLKRGSYWPVYVYGYDDEELGCGSAGSEVCWPEVAKTHPEACVRTLRHTCLLPEHEPVAQVASVACLATQRAKQARERERELEERATKLPRTGSGSPCLHAVELPSACGAVLSDSYCREAVLRYLAHPRTLCTPADAAAVDKSKLRLDRKADGQSVFVGLEGGWKLCECAGREHSKVSVKWIVSAAHDSGPTVVQYCHNDKCKSRDWRERQARAPRYEIRQTD